MSTYRERRLVRESVERIIEHLYNIRNTSAGKGTLAELRNSVGHPFSASIDVWSVFFDLIPTELLTKTGKTTRAEFAIFTTLQLFSIHQQGSQGFLPKTPDSLPINMGASLSLLRSVDNSKAIDRRFNAMITSANADELSVHLRQLVKLLKSKTQALINYSQLAEDLYQFNCGNVEEIRMKWAVAYYAKKDFNKGEYHENN